MCNQQNTKYHKFMVQLLNLPEYYDEKESLIKDFKELFLDNLKVQKELNKKGEYGIAYYTIHDDSSYSDKHVIFFKTKKLRDDVFNDWEKGVYWDNIFEDEIAYPKPSPNYHHKQSSKIFKKNNKIYYEDENIKT